MNDKPGTASVKEYWEKFPAGWGELGYLHSDPLAFLEERDRQTKILSPRIAELYRMYLARDVATLDIGCGQGYNAQELVRHGAKLTAIDLTSKGLELATSRFDIRGLHANFLLADAQRLPFQDESFGYLHSSGVIHHIPDMGKVAAEMYRVLRPTGHASIMIYNKTSWVYWFQFQFRLRTIMTLLYLMPTAIRRQVIKRKPGLSKCVPSRWPRTADIINAGTDFGGVENPLSRVFTRKQVARLFHQFKVMGFATSGSPYQPFKTKKNVVRRMIASIISRLNRRFGWYLYVYLEK
ncbi:MAG: class I SAM-dependent methyltransferase [Chloroflexi bacterium]|nr:class I SAM-dependent methyltransferase [Chloroflexota bacterium]